MLSTFAEILNGAPSNEETTTRLEQYFLEHPYSPLLAILLAKIYKTTGDVRFESALRKAAILANSREQLHNIIFKDALVHEPAVEQISEIVDSPTQPSSATKKAPDKPEKVNESEKPDSDPLLKQFVAEALSAGAALELLNDDSTTSDLSQSAEPPKASDSKAEKKNQLKSEPTSEPIQKPVVVPEKQPLSAWLEMMGSTSEVIEGASFTPPELTTSKNQNPEVIDLINSFIAQEDQIVPKRAEFFSPSKAAKASLTDKEDIVSETLARIYADQGNVPKAISTYEKLSLLHPEKSSYFAALIENLKSEQKHKS